MELNEFPDGEQISPEPSESEPATEPLAHEREQKEVGLAFIQFYDRVAKGVSLVSVVIEGLSIFVFLGIGIIDWVATLIVVWRFFSGSELDSPEIVEYRELKADVGVCLGMLLITCTIVLESLYHVINQSRPDNHIVGTRGYASLLLHSLLAVITAGVSIFVLGFLAAIKFRVAQVLQSGSMLKDAIMGVTGVIVNIGILFSMQLYKWSDHEVWYLDPIIGLMIAGLLYTVALTTLVSEWHHRWWTIAFWRATEDQSKESARLNSLSSGLESGVGGIDLSDSSFSFSAESSEG